MMSDTQAALRAALSAMFGEIAEREPGLARWKAFIDEASACGVIGVTAGAGAAGPNEIEVRVRLWSPRGGAPGATGVPAADPEAIAARIRNVAACGEERAAS
ncbi:MAG: hypothetical protein ABL308_12770 [Oceanicaulis sp.]